MDTLMIILRLVHIFAGIFWVGAGLFLLIILMPVMEAMGEEGNRFRMGFVSKSRFNAAMPIASLLTTAAGVWLFVKVSDQFNSDWMSSDGGIVMSIGALAGVLAFGHGAAVTGPTFSKMAEKIKAIEAQGGPPGDAQIAELQELGHKSHIHGRISILLMVISVIGMAAARYM